jgi:hypothetical protein
LQINAIKSCMNSLLWSKSLNCYLHSSEMVILILFLLWLNICCESANLMFWQWCCWSCNSPGTWHCVLGQVVPDVLWYCGSFPWRVR